MSTILNILENKKIIQNILAEFKRFRIFRKVHLIREYFRTFHIILKKFPNYRKSSKHSKTVIHNYNSFSFNYTYA